MGLIDGIAGWPINREDTGQGQVKMTVSANNIRVRNAGTGK